MNRTPETTVKKWLDDDGYLQKSKVCSWMESMVDIAVKEYKKLPEEDRSYEITTKKSGPAFTLEVKPTSDIHNEFSVDIVPVFVFNSWPEDIENLRGCPEGDKTWFAVPKPQENEKDTNTNFRLSFWHQEKKLLNDKDRLKPALKLIKKIRDVNNWNGISSYHIKTIFLWKNENLVKDDWSKRTLSEVFIEMFAEMQYYFLERKELPFYWQSEFDLWSKLNADNKTNFGNRIKNMIKELDKHLDEPDYIYSWFKKTEGSNALTPRTEEVAQTETSLAPLIVVGGIALAGLVGLTAAAVAAHRQLEQEQRPPKDGQRRNDENKCSIM